MNWTNFLLGIGILASAFLSYLAVRGKTFLDGDIYYGSNWVWVIFGAIGGPVLMLSAIPLDVSIPIVFVLLVVGAFFLFRWLYRVIRRLIKGQEQ